MEPQVIAALTSWKERIYNELTGPVLYSYISQESPVPFKVVLVLSSDEFPEKEKEVPKDIMKMARGCDNFEILWCRENTGPYKKYFPVRKKYPDLPIITVDDDSTAYPHFMKTLWELHRKNPDRVIYGCDGKPYSWIGKRSIDCVRYGVALYPPGSTYDLDEQFGMKYFKFMDDEFMRLLCLLNRTHYVSIDANSVLVINAFAQDKAIGRVHGREFKEISEMWGRLGHEHPELKKIWVENRKIPN